SSSMIRMHPCEEEGPSVKCRGMTAASDIDRLSQQREIQIESCSFFRGTLDANLAGVLLNDPVCDRQTEAGATFLTILRCGLGGEEGIVNALDVLLCDSAAGIRNHYAHAIAVRSSDVQGSAIGHCVFGIQEQVQEDLLQAPGVALNHRKVGRKLIVHTDLRGPELVF